MVLHHQILFSLTNAAMAEAILMRTSAEQVSLVTSFSFWPFMLKSALMLIVLLVMSLLCAVLTPILYAVALSTSLLVRS